MHWLNPFRTRPHLNVVWYNNSWLGFLKFWIIYQKKEKNFLQKMSPHLSELNVAMAHRNYFRWNNLQILKLATYTKIGDHYTKIGDHYRFKHLFEQRVLSKIDKIMADESHPLNEHYTFNRSGIRLRVPRTNKARFRQSFVPNSIHIFNHLARRDHNS